MDNVTEFPGKGGGEGIGGTSGGGAPIYGGISAGGGSGGTIMGGGLGNPYINRPPQANLSFVEDHEDIQAQSVIDEQFRELTKDFLPNEFPGGLTWREHARLTRYFCAVKIYIRPDEIKLGPNGEHSLILPESVRAEDRYQSCVGLVIALGPQAFQDKDGNARGSKYKTGDWIVFARTDIVRVDFCGIPVGIMTDDRSLLVTDDPRFWMQGSLTYKG